MNTKIKSFGFVLALTAFAMAQEAAPVADAAAPAAEPAVAAPAPEATEAPIEEEKVATEETPSATPEATAPASQETSEVAAQEPAPTEQVAPAAEPESVNDAMPAPKAVRGVDAEAQPVYAEAQPAPAPVAVPETRVYRIKADPVPMKFTFGAQGFIGTNTLFDNNWDYSESYSGIAWKAGLFAVIPLNEYTMGFKIGALFDYSDASATYLYGSGYNDEAQVKFKQQRITVPLLFMLKSTYSNFSFDFGVQFSVPVQDEFKYSYEKSDGTPVSGNADMIDLDYRSSMDFAMLLGLCIKANRYMSFDIRYEFGFSNLYDSVPGWRINDLTTSTLLFGLSFYVL